MFTVAGLRFLTVVHLLKTPLILQIIHILKSRSNIQIVRTIVTVAAVWFIGAGMMVIVSGNGDPGNTGIQAFICLPRMVWILDEGSKGRCQGVIRKCIRTGYLNEDFGSFAEHCENADDGLFRAILGNNNHVLHQLLPPIKNCPYALRPRVHNHELPAAKNNSLRKNFMYRMLYKNTY